LYGKPFEKSYGMDRLPIEMVPEEYLAVHNQLIVIRDKLYAHSDASKTVNVGTCISVHTQNVFPAGDERNSSYP
jgi:hypothetical protein